MNYNYIQLPPFKWYVLQNFPFIEADFDAITNWQLFCKLGEEINKLVNATNSAGVQVEYLTDYVNNYFENLDVQGEIDNKLDEMVESGELQELISQYLDSQAIIGFNTNSDLANATNLINGSFARTLSKTSYNDGKGAFYKIRTLTNADVPDGDNIIRLVNTTNLVAEKMKDFNIENINNELDIIKNKYVIMIGDSYANRTNSWQDRIKTFMGLTDSNCNMKRVSGTGFCHTVDNQNFRTMLTDNITIPPDKVTDILVCGGYNDMNYTQEERRTAIANFLNTCKNTYPNAKVYIGMISWCIPPISGYDTKIDNLSSVLDDYKWACSYYRNAVYLNNVEYSLHDAALLDDTYFHPTADGQDMLAHNIMDSWKSGFTRVRYLNNITSSFTPNTGINLGSDARLYGYMNNNSSKILSGIDITHFAFDQTTQYNLNSWITLGTFTAGTLFGKYNLAVTKANILLNTVNNGYFYYTGEIRVHSGVLSVRLRTLNRQGNNWVTDDAINYIQIFNLKIECDSMLQF